MVNGSILSVVSALPPHLQLYEHSASVVDRTRKCDFCGSIVEVKAAQMIHV
jgi:hypothetical protein